MKVLFTLTSLLLTTTLAAAQSETTYQLHRYDSNDGGIILGMNDNGQWGIIHLGTSSGGGNATPKLFDVENDEAIEISYDGEIISVNDVSSDGNIVVGSWYDQAVAYNRTSGELITFPMRDDWAWCSLSAVTPDGRWAVGQYSGYTGVFSENGELTGDFYFSPILVDIQNADTLALPGLPQLDMANLDQHALSFNAITPDGRYVLGQMDWYIMQPVSGFSFVYDTQEHNYRVIGFEENNENPWQPLYPYLHHIEGGCISPNGKFVAGLAYMTKPQANSEFFNEYGVPFRYNIETSELEIFDDGESNNISVGAITDDGTMFGNPDSGSPLRNFRIFYKDKYWISFSQICQQAFGFNFQEKTGYEYTGTVTGVSADGRYFSSFVDPLGESYIFDLGKTVNEICSGIDLLDNYTVFPEAGASFALISDIEINFGRNVQVLGNGSNVHLYTKEGTLVYSGLSNGGLSLKTGSRNTVVAAFRTRPLEPGTEYELVIDAGAICINGDHQLVNQEIRIPYSGRANAPVRMVRATPSEESSLNQIDNTTSYLLLDFDTQIKTTESAHAYIERVEDGGLLTTLNIATGTTSSTRHQALLMPSSTQYLYSGEDYRVVIEEGSLCDYSYSTSSYNQRIEIIYHGSYVREVASESVMFADDFNDPNKSLMTWLRFEGDHLTPSKTMEAWGFDADNNPWNFTLRDSEETGDFFAGSHSIYSPMGKSDDWMITPQINVPLDGQAVLEFDAQSYDPTKEDYLIIYIYQSRRFLSYLNTEIMNDIRNEAVCMDSIRLTSGAMQEFTAGEWTHYNYSLAPWAGKDIYIAFVNQNENQSAVFVDNVQVQREILYRLAFNNRERVVDEEQMIISGQFTVMCDETEGSASLTLRNDEGEVIGLQQWETIPAKGTPMDFRFDQPLTLIPGTEVLYTIDIQIGEKEDIYYGSIYDLAFEPVKRVVLEEMTGTTCVNCPLGIVSIEACENAFGDRFIPVGIHSYTGDNMGSAFYDYSTFLGLMGAPMARINRLPEVYSPMFRKNDEFYYHDVEGEELWYDIVAQELNTLTLADLDLKAELSEDAKQISFETTLRYALDAYNQQLSLLLLVLENGITSFQLNGFSSAESETLGDWCNGGRYADYTVYPYTHDHVLRGLIGQTYSGTIGLFPTQLQGGERYVANLSSACPESIQDLNQLHAVAMLINTQTGQVINAAQTAIQANSDAIHNILQEDSANSSTLRTLNGIILKNNATAADLHSLPSGIYLWGKQKIFIQ